VPCGQSLELLSKCVSTFIAQHYREALCLVTGLKNIYLLSNQSTSQTLRENHSFVISELCCEMHSGQTLI